MLISLLWKCDLLLKIWEQESTVVNPFTFIRTTNYCKEQYVTIFNQCQNLCQLSVITSVFFLVSIFFSFFLLLCTVQKIICDRKRSKSKESSILQWLQPLTDISWANFLQLFTPSGHSKRHSTPIISGHYKTTMTYLWLNRSTKSAQNVLRSSGQKTISSMFGFTFFTGNTL